MRTRGCPAPGVGPPGSVGTSPWVVAGSESLGRGRWGGLGGVVAGRGFLLVRWCREARMRAKHGQMWPSRFRGWERSGALGLPGPRERGTEPEGGGALGLGGPEPGQRSSWTRSERAAAGRAGPAAEVKGRGLRAAFGVGILLGLLRASG